MIKVWTPFLVILAVRCSQYMTRCLGRIHSAISWFVTSKVQCMPLRVMPVVAGRLLISTDRGHIYCFAPRIQTKTSTEEPPQPTKASPAPTVKPSVSQLAQRLIQSTGADIGYALVLGCGDGHLAGELARHSRLRVIGVDPDAKRVNQA